MNVLKMMVVRGWAAIVIAALAVIGYFYEWPVAVLGTVLGVVLVIGLAVVAVNAREKELEQSANRLRQLAGYFSRRFMGDSSLSIFAIINSLFKADNPRLWDWARACDMSQRIFNTWSDAFTSRLEADTRTGRFVIYLRTYLNELWLMTNLYHEYIEQFSEIAEKVAMPQETLEQYYKFAVEYNTFVEQFRDAISELKKVARTEVEPPSVKMVHEVTGQPIVEEKK
jgi:ABC-type transport system involved in cytochrome bd biosynthesis fused ATPase/permease subunit